MVRGGAPRPAGLEAFQTLVATFQPADELALVLVQHLDPDHQSLLVELLSKTPTPRRHRGRPEVEAGRIYLILGRLDHHEDGRLRLHTFRPRGLRRPIDQFLKALAAQQLASSFSWH
jgi:two-component system CheB/CheR fusion protein